MGFNLDDFRKLRTPEDRIGYLNGTGAQSASGDGSNRVYYNIFLNDNKLERTLKLALNHRGKLLNKKELKTVLGLGKDDGAYFPIMFPQKAPDYAWILTEVITPIRSAREFQNKTRIQLNHIEDGMHFLSPKIQKLGKTNTTYKRLRHVYETLSKENPWYANLIKFATARGIPVQELVGPDSWGVANGDNKRIVLLNPVGLLSFGKRNGIFTW